MADNYVNKILNKEVGQMLTTAIFPGRYIQGYRAIMTLGFEVKRFGDIAFLICSPSAYQNLLPGFKPEAEKTVRIVADQFGGECSDEEIEKLCNLVSKAKCHVVCGIGGGKTLDTAKAVAFNLKLPVIIAPTIASNDAPCSALSVIYTSDGAFKRYLKLPKNPDVVLVDTKIISEAPVRFLIAGIGDALSTWFEAESCKNKYALNMSGNIGAMTAYALARLCYDTLLEYGAMAKTACEQHIVTPALEHIIEANILLSGLGFESAGLAAAHAIHNGLTVSSKTRQYLHGEKVAIGTQASLFLTDKPTAIIDQVYLFCKSVGLPTTLDDIGLSGVSDADLLEIAQRACAEEETIHNEPMPISPEAVVFALKAADIEGKRRKRQN
jgi:glycerol dehydrogenase